MRPPVLTESAEYPYPRGTFAYSVIVRLAPSPNPVAALLVTAFTPELEGITLTGKVST